MPIIEFYCEKCQRKFEELIFKNSELASIKCPKCGNKKLRRLFSTFGLVSKGSSGLTDSSGLSCSSCSRTSCAGCGT